MPIKYKRTPINKPTIGKYFTDLIGKKLFVGNLIMVKNDMADRKP
jgi:hypothetical protein